MIAEFLVLYMTDGIDMPLYLILFSDMCNATKKSCNCSDVPVIYDMTKLQTNATLYGINEATVNASLTSIAIWDAEQIKLVCKREYKLKGLVRDPTQRYLPTSFANKCASQEQFAKRFRLRRKR